MNFGNVCLQQVPLAWLTSNNIDWDRKGFVLGLGMVSAAKLRGRCQRFVTSEGIREGVESQGPPISDQELWSAAVAWLKRAMLRLRAVEVTISVVRRKKGVLDILQK